MGQILHITDFIVFLLMAVSVGYLFFFAFFSMGKGREKYPNSEKKLRIVVLIPAYKEDSVIEESVMSLLAQTYPKDKLDIVVVSDKMSDMTNETLLKLPIKLFKINPDNSSKAYALNYAIDMLRGLEYDVVIVLDADNTVDPGFISGINDAFRTGVLAVQAHRTAKNLNNDMAVLDAVSEEINNSIFRKGHVKAGLSSALIGSGMAFDYTLFANNVRKLTTAGEDKELELLLFKNGVFVDFLDYLMVYDEKIKKERAFYNQRRRWMAAQFGSLFAGLKDLPEAIISLKVDYIDKIFQWLLLPRIVMLGVIAISALITTLADWRLSVKWWILLLSLILAFTMAIPGFLVTRRNMKTIRRLPLIFILMFLNLFRTAGVNKKFIHTQKG